VFPGLDRLRDGDSLEARFNAFKIPESNFLVFEANVRTCREGCQPAYCSGGTGRSEPSFGRRRRDVNNDTIADEDEVSPITVMEGDVNNASATIFNMTDVVDEEPDDEEEEEHVREMIEVADGSFSFRREIERTFPFSCKQVRTIKCIRVCGRFSIREWTSRRREASSRSKRKFWRTFA